MKKALILLAALICVGAASGFLLKHHAQLQVALPQTFDPPPEEDDPPLCVAFSKQNTFYDEDIEVALSCKDPDAEIYYTTDGNDPTTASKKYTAPIALSARAKVTASTIKAIAVSAEGETSEIFLKSYVMGKNVFERFAPSTLVFILSTDEYNLYDYYYGVATEGYKRDEYLNSDEYRGGEVDYNAPANWFIRGRESERPMYVEVYDPAGNQLISQAAGGRVVGGVSRATEQKSWRLIARNLYSEGNGKFKYAFFPGATDAYGNLLTRFDRITLRNNANDREFAAIRDELSMTLSARAGFPDTQCVRPAAVFLNGEYYGFSWLHEAYSNDYLEAVYGGTKENFKIVGTKEKEVEGDDEQSVADWEHVLEVAARGLTVDRNFNEFCELVDLDDFMLYYAIQIYIDNKDWPGNNFKAWRYYPAEGETVESEYLDGRWRFLLFDAEYAWGLYGNGYRDNTLSNVLTGNHMQGSSALLSALLERADMRKKFANTVCDLIGGAFSAESALETVEALIAESDPECMYALENGYTSTWARAETFADSRQQVRDFAVNRPDVMLRSLRSEFKYGDEMYAVTLHNPTGAESFLNSQKLDAAGSLGGRYFTACSVPIGAKVYPGYAFDYWTVNGNVYTSPSFELTSAMADENGEIEVFLYLKKAERSDSVYVSELYTAGDGDWIELYNPSDTAAILSGCYLSDDELDLKKWALPRTEIPAKGTFTVACKNNDRLSALKKYRTNFSLKTGETLYFTDADGAILSKVAVVEMEEDQSLVRRLNGRYTVGAVSEGSHTEE
ncbi:MAG: CotH kinase family protein [Bacteroides sp.]|nr:CotH kinase family protein [Eubacterium sp.]MCM1417890.1 CotH kinase family protein [Roseburia sp.]MCM1461946.1 CotH kinase family protein [Bacteroides sp.]